MNAKTKTVTVKIPYISGVFTFAGKVLSMLFITTGKTIQSVPSAVTKVRKIAEDEYISQFGK